MRALLFDVDGVLIDSYAGYRMVWNRWSESRGLDAELVWAATHGRRPVDTLADIAPHLDASVEYAALRQLMRQVGDRFPPMPGAAKLTTGLPSEQWGVVTSGQRQTVLARFARSGIPAPRVLVDSGDVKNGKPAPDGYLLAASTLGANPVDCLVVEDAPGGVDAGKAAGMRVLAIAATHDVRELDRADQIVPDLVAAAPLIRSWLAEGPSADNWTTA